MSPEALKDRIQEIRTADEGALERMRVALLGRRGELTEALRGLKSAPPEDRRRLGQELNAAKAAIEEAIAERGRQLEDAARGRRLLAEALDVTLPGSARPRGAIHPLTQVSDRLESIFVAMGFEVRRGPEIEDDWHNFEALNFPKDHPSRDMQDSFQIPGDLLLRTHTSPVQVRTMQERAPQPVRVICPGRVFRRDDDATHSPVFHQIEALAVGRGVTMAHLKGTLFTFARELFGQDVPLRLRPSFFPFTEPSAELDIGCLFCEGRGCRVCKESGWLEVLGAGMVHPRVLANGGYDPTEVTGFALGLGVERIAQLYFGIPDIRLMFQGDVRFLRQF